MVPADKQIGAQHVFSRFAGTLNRVVALGKNLLGDFTHTGRGFEPEKLLGTPPLDIAQVEVAAAIDGHGVNPVELAGALAFGESREPCQPPSGVKTMTSWSLGGIPTTRPGMGSLGQRMGDEPHT